MVRNSVSVVIPALNEADRIAAVIETTRAQSPMQIIVVDGGSDDATVSTATGADVVLTSAPGRAIQQNLGAAQCCGEVILFLHADCVLGAGALDGIAAVATDDSVIAGCLTQVIDSPRLALRAIARGNNLRARLLKWAYGDQAIWVRRSLFERLGGFPQVPFMEDLLLMKQLKRQPGRFVRLKPTVTTPPRHWERRGAMRQTLLNWWLIAQLHLGRSPAKMIER